MRTIVLAAAVLLSLNFLTGCQSVPSVPVTEAEPVEELEGSFNNIYAADGFYFAGYPTVEGLEAMRERGVTTVVSTKTPEQVESRLGRSERELVESLGMRMVYIPISPESFSDNDVDRLADLIEHRDGPMLLHCGSSNTIGGLWASYLHREQGVPLDRAMEIGESAGLRADSMIEATRRVAEEP